MDLSFKSLGKLFNAAAPAHGGSVVGIDFGSSSIKIVQLRREHQRAVLETYGELQLGPYANVDVGRATNLEPGKTTEALLDIVREASVTSRNVGVAVPYAASFVTVISLQVEDPALLEAMIPIEARKYVPVPVSQVTLDWFVVPNKNGAESAGRVTTTRVLLAAIHNEALSKFKTVIEGAGMLSSFNEIEVFSTIRSSVQKIDETILIMDIGAATTKLYVVAGGIVQATHSITVGGQDLTSALSKSLELTISDAEEMKRQVGLLAHENPRIERALSLPLERMFIESRRLLEAYERTNGAVPVSSVMLSGGGATLAGVAEYAQNVLGRRILNADPFAKVEYPAFLQDTLKTIGPSFAVAVGAALRRLSER